MFFVGIDIAKTFSVCSVIDDKEEMIIKPFSFNSSTGGFNPSSSYFFPKSLN